MCPVGVFTVAPLAAMARPFAKVIPDPSGARCCSEEDVVAEMCDCHQRSQEFSGSVDGYD